VIDSEGVPSMADDNVELGDPNGIKKSTRLIEFSFNDQFSAVWTKTTVNQARVFSAESPFGFLTSPAF